MRELSFGRKLVYAGIATVGILGMTEGILRLVLREAARISIPAKSVEEHVQVGMAFDPDLGWTWKRVPQPEVGINEAGFRYGTLTLSKPPGTWRAFTLGDSQTYGAGVDSDKTYTAVAERLLNQAIQGQTIATSAGGIQHVELVNAGISGYTSLQTLRLIEKKLLDWKPDAILIDNRTFDAPRDVGLPTPSARVAALQRILFQSRIYYVMRFVMDRLAPHQPRRMRADAVSQGPTPTTSNLPPREGNAETLKSASVAHRPPEFGNHSLIVERLEAQGIQVIFLTYPFWDSRQDRINCLAPQPELPADAPVAPVCEALQQDNHPPKVLFLDNNHPTVLGHSLMGQVVATTLLRENPQLHAHSL